MDITQRSMETLERQFKSLRDSVKYRNPETGKRSHLHCDWCRKPAGAYLREFRDELRRRKVLPVSYVVHIQDMKGKRTINCKTAQEAWDALGKMSLGGLYSVSSPVGLNVSTFVPF